MYRKCKPILVAVLILILLTTLFIVTCVTIIPSGYTGVRITMGQIEQTTLRNGTVVTAPFIQKVEKVNNKQQDITYNDQIWGESSERAAVYMNGITIGYRIMPEYHPIWIKGCDVYAVFR